MPSYTPGVSERRGSTSTWNFSSLKNAETQVSSYGVTTATKTYDAFGNVVSISGTWKGAFGYAGGSGYQEDVSGLKLLGHRYYDSSTGRFLTRDPAMDGRNWYTYCENAPLISVDPEGLWSLYRWMYTGDGDASDESYEAGLNQAGQTRKTWLKHFAIDNGIIDPGVATVIGPYPKAWVPPAIARTPVLEGSSPFTSGIRVLGQKLLPALRPAADFVKESQVEIWIIVEAPIAWLATYQTLIDPDSWLPPEE